MFKLNYFILVIILLITISCKDDYEPTVLRGTVRDFYHNKPISNISLRICERPNPRDIAIGDLFHPYDSLGFVKKIKVDNQGNFECVIDNLQDYGECLIAYNDYEKLSDSCFKITKEKENFFDIKLKYYNELKLKLKTDRLIDSIRLIVDDGYLYTQNARNTYTPWKKLIFSKNFDKDIHVKSVPDCWYRITLIYKTNTRWNRIPDIHKYVTNTDTTELVIEW
ncbi:MAG: hypothetical protein MI739_04350 [Bacteroidales bacterium]|nr:hypothetical protein [Bacteroidales bacterium]